MTDAAFPWETPAAPAPQSGTYPWDSTQSADDPTPRVSAISQAFTQTFGPEPFSTPATALSDETVATMKRAGIFNDYATGKANLVGAILEQGIRVGAAGLELAARIGRAGVNAVAHAPGIPNPDILANDPQLGGAIANFLIPLARLPETINVARANGAIGETDAAFHGVEPPTPAAAEARNEAVIATAGARENPANKFELQSPLIEDENVREAAVRGARSAKADGARDAAAAIKQGTEEGLAYKPSPAVQKALDEKLKSTGISIHNIHEGEAASVSAERAPAVADNMRAEIESITAQQHPELHDELTGRPGEAEGEPKKGTGVSDRPATPGSAPGESGEPQGSGAVPAGGKQAAAKGSESTNPGRDTTQPVEHWDKAGNIRLDNLDSSVEINKALSEWADANNGFIAARRGEVSDREILDYMNAAGLSSSDANIARLRAISLEDNIPLAARILGGRKMLVASAQNAIDVARAGDPIAYAVAEQRLLRVQETISAVTAEMGRGLRAFQSMAMEAQKAEELSTYMLENTGLTLAQIRKRMAHVAGMDTPAKVAGFLQASNRAGLGAMALEAFRNWLIASFKTHVAYFVGNMTLAAMKAIPETAVQALFHSAKSALGYEVENRVRMGEVMAQIYSFGAGNRAGLASAYATVKSGRVGALPNEIRAPGEMGTPFLPSRRVIPGVAGAIINAPGERMIGSIHAYSRQIGYANSIARQAYRAASDAGLTGEAHSLSVAEWTQFPTKDMMRAAVDEANETALMGKSGKFTAAVSKAVNTQFDIPGLGVTQPFAFLAPFVGVPGRLLNQTLIQRSPLGLLFPSIWHDLSGAAGDVAQATAFSRIVVGSSVLAGSAALAMEGRVNSAAPLDPKDRAAWLALHGIEHGINIDGVSVDTARFGALGKSIGLGADLYHVAKVHSGEDLAESIANVTLSTASTIVDDSSLKDISDLFRALREPAYAQIYMRNFVSAAAVPFSSGMSAITQSVDPNKRQVNSISDALLAKIPWASEGLKPQRNVWGDKMLNKDWAVTYYEHLQQDPIDLALRDVGIYPGKAERILRGVQLSDDQYEDYQQARGQYMKQFLAAAINTPNFASLPSGVKESVMRNAIASGTQAGEAETLQRHAVDLLPKINQHLTDAITQGSPAAAKAKERMQ